MDSLVYCAEGKIDDETELHYLGIGLHHSQQSTDVFLCGLVKAFILLWHFINI